MDGEQSKISKSEPNTQRSTLSAGMYKAVVDSNTSSLSAAESISATDTQTMPRIRYLFQGINSHASDKELYAIIVLASSLVTQRSIANTDRIADLDLVQQPGQTVFLSINIVKLNEVDKPFDSLGFISRLRNALRIFFNTCVSVERARGPKRYRPRVISSITVRCSGITINATVAADAFIRIFNHVMARRSKDTTPNQVSEKLWELARRHQNLRIHRLQELDGAIMAQEKLLFDALASLELDPDSDEEELKKLRDLDLGSEDDEGGGLEVNRAAKTRELDEALNVSKAIQTLLAGDALDTNADDDFWNEIHFTGLEWASGTAFASFLRTSSNVVKKLYRDRNASRKRDRKTHFTNATRASHSGRGAERPSGVRKHRNAGRKARGKKRAKAGEETLRATGLADSMLGNGVVM